MKDIIKIGTNDPDISLTGKLDDHQFGFNISDKTLMIRDGNNLIKFDSNGSVLKKINFKAENINKLNGSSSSSNENGDPSSWTSAYLRRDTSHATEKSRAEYLDTIENSNRPKGTYYKFSLGNGLIEIVVLINKSGTGSSNTNMTWDYFIKSNKEISRIVEGSRYGSNLTGNGYTDVGLNIPANSWTRLDADSNLYWNDWKAIRILLENNYEFVITTTTNFEGISTTSGGGDDHTISNCTIFMLMALQNRDLGQIINA